MSVAALACPKLGGTTSFTNSGEYLHRIRFEMHEKRVRVHRAERGGGGSKSVPNAKLAQFLKEHWNKLDVQVLATDGSVEIDTDRALEFLTIRIPKDLLPELEQRAGKRIADRYRDAPFYQAIYGTPKAMADYDRQQAEGSQ